MGDAELSAKLVRARKTRGLTRAKACELMPHTLYGTLQHLEGEAVRSGEKRPPADPASVQIKTAADIVRAYWPDIALRDFIGDSGDLEFDMRKGF